MAGSSLDDGVQKHQKVYSFLKRMLPQDRYEGVRVIEPCVVVADGFKKSFQFAVLGDEMLYITENPPRTSKDIRLKVDLACVTSVELVSFKTRLKLDTWVSIDCHSIASVDFCLQRLQSVFHITLLGIP